MRSAQDQRIATESAEKREARLQQLRVAQQHRIATETSEDFEATRARDRRNHMDLETAEVPLFQQTRVRVCWYVVPSSTGTVNALDFSPWLIR